MSKGPVRAYLDANVLIGMVEAQRELGDGQLAFLARLDRGEVVAATSQLSLAEVLVKPLATHDQELVAAYDAFFQPGGALDVVPISREILVGAARLRSVTRMKLPDAIHVATAEAVGCGTFVSSDRGVRLPHPMRHLVWSMLKVTDVGDAP